MRSTVVYDCEYLTNRTSPRRFWCGPHDPDPTVVQIGAVRLGLEGDMPLLDRFEVLIRPRDRSGGPTGIDPFLTELTGLTADRVASEGVSLTEALDRFGSFSAGARCWSWGKDELNLIAVSCWIEGIAPPMLPSRFGNAAALVLRAGEPLGMVENARSNTLAGLLGVATPPLRAHDGLDDATAVALALRHLLRADRLRPEDLL
jgi:DNA polymerase III epsilon subunit-like protein